ncbi:MAG TPA: hypothetical protein ENO10_08705 [Salinimicrobium catena]|uniref:Sulfotransferase family protein n=1 Tax=Salinimicrobium catena TaxID=390640 RepID=A0A7C2M5V1_9FLAO|nr:hypothetical protein [Salinimicrobium catena]
MIRMDLIRTAKKALKFSYLHARRLKIQYQVKGNTKIFCIGANKTGTTSLKKAMDELGFVVGAQITAENLVDDWAQRDFRRIIKYCKSAEFFQDAPFSFEFTYIVMDHAFPGSKFILTERDSPEQWYNSVVRFHSKMWGKDGNLPTKKNLQEAKYIYKGRPWHMNRMLNTTPEDDIYNKEILMQRYIDHNKSIKYYFRHRPGDLLVINVADDDSYTKLCEFLGVERKRDTFPWLNQTDKTT